MRIALTALFAFFGQVAIVAAASIPAIPYDTTGTPFNPYPDDVSWGWTFEVHAPVVVTHLGWRDRNGDGLSHSHLVGLWSVPALIGNTGEVLLTSLEVPGGTSGELVGPWRRALLPTPMTLSPGLYEITGQQFEPSTDPIEYGFASPGGDPRVSLGYPGQAFVEGLQPIDFFFLSGDGRTSGLFGPMFFIQVPEPSAFALSTLLLAICRRSRRQQEQAAK